MNTAKIQAENNLYNEMDSLYKASWLPENKDNSEWMANAAKRSAEILKEIAKL